MTEVAHHDDRDLFWWIGLSIVVAVAADTRDRSPIAWFIYAIIFSPLLLCGSGMMRTIGAISDSHSRRHCWRMQPWPALAAALLPNCRPKSCNAAK
jgi:hypothetical protein